MLVYFIGFPLYEESLPAAPKVILQHTWYLNLCLIMILTGRKSQGNPLHGSREPGLGGCVFLKYYP